MVTSTMFELQRARCAGQSARRAGQLARCADRGLNLVLSGALIVAPAVPARAAACSFEAQGEGRVAAVTDARGFRLEDGREVRLAGIEPALSATSGNDRAITKIARPRWQRSSPAMT